MQKIHFLIDIYLPPCYNPWKVCQIFSNLGFFFLYLKFNFVDAFLILNLSKWSNQKQYIMSLYFRRKQHIIRLKYSFPVRLLCSPPKTGLITRRMTQNSMNRSGISSKPGPTAISRLLWSVWKTRPHRIQKCRFGSSVMKGQIIAVS